MPTGRLPARMLRHPSHAGLRRDGPQSSAACVGRVPAIPNCLCRTRSPFAPPPVIEKLPENTPAPGNHVEMMSWSPSPSTSAISRAIGKAAFPEASCAAPAKDNKSTAGKREPPGRLELSGTGVPMSSALAAAANRARPTIPTSNTASTKPKRTVKPMVSARLDPK